MAGETTEARLGEGNFLFLSVLLFTFYYSVFGVFLYGVQVLVGMDLSLIGDFLCVFFAGELTGSWFGKRVERLPHSEESTKFAISGTITSFGLSIILSAVLSLIVLEVPQEDLLSMVVSMPVMPTLIIVSIIVLLDFYILRWSFGLGVKRSIQK